jgi:hypothetical protein
MKPLKKYAVYNWCIWFKSGQELLDNKEHSSTKATSHNENVEKVCTVVTSDWCMVNEQLVIESDS